ncbi:PP2C family protein-serine/threonine phosphatase [Marinobacterium rhizophilum]|uniref:PP2C family protein-serine/threonine phosphatase n=1 Tax=Marinobacterium rhizophilum TaxID=420402 RepID=UPI00036FE2E5|nr:SpoIIE family protein phosphatase [Marinobacterium rhizophilum]
MNRILLLLDHEENRRLLAQWLEPQYQILPNTTNALLAGTFDLCILDAPALNRLWQQVEARKTRERPLFLPFLVVISQRYDHMITGLVRQCVDELINSPVEKTELVVRLENLMRIRQLSLELEAANAQLQRNLQRMKDDEEGGRHIQFQLLPTQNKQLGPYEFSHRLITSAYLSGDFIDYFAIDDQHLGFYMADVSGHGVSSAFITVLLKSYMTRYLEDYRENRDTAILRPHEVLGRLNHEICSAQLGKYLTMFYGVINQPDNQLLFSQGGQFPFPMLFDGSGSRFVGIKSLPVGLFEFAEYETLSLELPPAFTMALISDGILEVLPHTQLKDQLAFLLSLISKNDMTIESLIRALALNNQSPLPDDITFLMIRKRS